MLIPWEVVLKRSSARGRCLWHQTWQAAPGWQLHSQLLRAPSHPFPLSPPVRLSQVLGIFFASPSVNVSEGQQSSLFCGVATLYWSITAALCLLQTGGRGVSGAASGGGREVEREERGREGRRRKWLKLFSLLSSSFFVEPLYDSRPPTTRAL